ncbi:DNA repair protein RecN [Pontibacter sp. G13]|uniref:DNA repair protein RecN n=1 Tax=Pontibacter sp. G13 TaxID=3074898 RepID=UPI002889A96A|nr:DNA repair protein RecN [Pontibacter sp. G13]WNJ18932.1 DNA repair protein RecN [Pontibacter sp. G13]
MLTQLYIKNYALFSEADIAIPEGLTILTGETGAGKSLLVGALGLIMGRRVDGSVLLLSDEKCIVEARFQKLSRSVKRIMGKFEDFDADDGEVIIRREIRPNGKSRAFINDTPVSLQMLKQVSSLLLDLHGQNENQMLLSADKQMDLVDAYAESSHLVDAFGIKMVRLDKISEELDSVRAQEEESSRQLEYFRFMVDELEKAELQAEEEEQLEQELNLLQNSEDVREALGMAVERLYQQDQAIFNQLGELLDPLKRVEGVDKSIAEEVSRLMEVQESVKESAFSFQNMLDTVGSDPERLAFLEERLSLYHGLKLKYNCQSGADLVGLLDSTVGKLDEFQSLEGRIGDLEQQRSKVLEELTIIGQQLEQARIQGKGNLEKLVTNLLSEVGFEKARFEVAIERNEHADGLLEIEGQRVKPISKGINKVYFLIQTNPGMPAGPLSQIASGGEVSRVMLAIKAALAEKSDFPVMIFDEIDTGISGEIANKVGNVMKKLSRRFQILSITHLPQIAAKGANHLQVKKRVVGDSTQSTVETLAHEERVKVLAEMLSGASPTESAMKNAAELMSS